MHEHEQDNDNRQKSEQHRGQREQHDVHQEQVEHIRERERQGSGGYSDRRVARDQEYLSAGHHESGSHQRSVGYGYRPPRSSDWWGPWPDASIADADAHGQYDRHADWEQRDVPTGPYAGRGPKGYQRSDERIREEICEHLTIHPVIDASDIEVMVKKGDVTLTGSVESRAIKRLVEALTEAVLGVKEIDNNLRVIQR
jgi:osmotically-inducible protein OsmY